MIDIKIIRKVLLEKKRRPLAMVIMFLTEHIPQPTFNNVEETRVIFPNAASTCYIPKTFTTI